MFTISTRLRYGLLALIAVAEGEADGPVPLAGVARKLKISFKYLENIFKLFKKASIVRGTRGPEGGYVLAKSAEGLSLHEIFSALEGSLVELKCLEKEPVCSRLEFCPVSSLWRDFHGLVVDYLMRRNLREIMEQYHIAALGRN